jgi:NAD(P)-dependent dehydrogenase (short-subunit alcohol dehydrogenase family)
MARESRSLNGKVVAITGGGRGIGRAIAQSLAREGARVAVGDLDKDSAEATAAALGGDAIGLGLDVTDHAGFTAFLDEVERRLGPLDVLVNNAGIMVVTPLVEETGDSIARQLELNLRAVIHGTQEAMRRMTPRRSGHIVNVASIAGRTGFPHLATYAATKHGVVGLSESVRAELRGTGVEISVVMPSVVRTELAAGLADSRVKAVEVEDVADEVLGALKRPRFDVFVPRSNGPLVRLGSALPRAVREAMTRWLKADQPLLKADRSARASYEARAAASAPAAEEERSAV